jgi:hypothetical protein
MGRGVEGGVVVGKRCGRRCGGVEAWEEVWWEVWWWERGVEGGVEVWERGVEGGVVAGEEVWKAVWRCPFILLCLNFCCDDILILTSSIIKISIMPQSPLQMGSASICKLHSMQFASLSFGK